MRSDVRALIVSILMFLLWGTVLTYPFRAVSSLICDNTEAIVGKISMPAIASAVLTLLIIMGLACLGLLAGRKEISDYLALSLSLLGSILYCVKVVKTRQYSVDSVFVSLVLVVSVVLVLSRKTEWIRWVADAYIMALPVTMCYESVLNPLYRLLKTDIYKFSPFIVVPSSGIFSKAGDMLGVPLVAWGTCFFIVTLLPVIYLSGGRKEGKIRQ